MSIRLSTIRGINILCVYTSMLHVYFLSLYIFHMKKKKETKELNLRFNK